MQSLAEGGVGRACEKGFSQERILGIVENGVLVAQVFNL